MRGLFIRVLLAILNSRWLNTSPCRYGYVNNIEAFDIANLRSEVRRRPELSVVQLIREAEAFAACSIRKAGLTVLEGGTARDGTEADVKELRDSLSR